MNNSNRPRRQICFTGRNMPSFPAHTSKKDAKVAARALADAVISIDDVCDTTSGLMDETDEEFCMRMRNMARGLAEANTGGILL